ncbi:MULTISPECIES: spore germination protein [unclassified Paenibacillus]|uniref:spore germination protein n=1 Tax=unclassified Paenibacillus TaxID=185978 RepID=UPI0009557CA5|nr:MULTISPECIES: spore germination protein [unclassified Paenibacillus]ASS65892.2 spore germination protein [Paenibacillus sp. RUD330]SIQ19874.1 GerA spore germination protein [Paenibacillus sp. RU4X]SIQ41511.1 GerA spore germination protein [Paenibacillus sp. RU4T]
MQYVDPEIVHRLESGLQERFHQRSDFLCKQIVVAGEKFKAYYLRTLVNLPMTLSILNQIGIDRNHDLKWDALHSMEADAAVSLDALYDLVLQGKLILLGGEGFVAIIEPEHAELSRPVMIPNSENPLQSAFDAFTEDLDINIGLIRKKMISDQLVIETRFVGNQSIKKLAMVYLKGTARPEVIEAVEKKLDENARQELTTVRDLTRILGHPKFTLFPTYISSELPEETVQNLLHGKVVILMDQFSFAFAFPAIVSDLWSTTLDVHYPLLFQLFLRAIRGASLLLSLTLPGLYVVLNSVNPELLRIQLAITVAKSREGVPYPSLIEALMVLLLLEMIIEATIRLPKNIGPTITMIGGILLGQAIVQAKLVSNLLIIILVASAISNFALTSYMNAVGVRLYKYVVLIVSAFFGIWGLEAAVIWLTLYLASLTTCSVPYLSFSLKGKIADE